MEQEYQELQEKIQKINIDLQQLEGRRASVQKSFQSILDRHGVSSLAELKQKAEEESVKNEQLMKEMQEYYTAAKEYRDKAQALLDQI